MRDKLIACCRLWALAFGLACGVGCGSLTVLDEQSQGPIRLGTLGPYEGPNENLGLEMRRGIEAMLSRFNLTGGAFGRRVELETRDHDDDIDTAIDLTRVLLDVEEASDRVDVPDKRGPNGVFGLIGNVGTHTTLAMAPTTEKNGVLLFAPATGTRNLRDATAFPHTFTFRASYAEEAAAIMDFVRTQRDPRILDSFSADRRILVFAQDDAYGDDGYDAVLTAYNQIVAPVTRQGAIPRVGYVRNVADTVYPAVAQALEFLQAVLSNAKNSDSKESVMLVLIGTQLPTDLFVRGIKDWINAESERASRLDVLFASMSSVDADALATALGAAPATYLGVADGLEHAYSENVIVTQVVPHYAETWPAVAEYREDLQTLDAGDLTFSALEGYLATRLFVEALQRNGPRLSSERLLDTLNTKMGAVDIGMGQDLGFSVSNHQACSTVWVTAIEHDGSFSTQLVWTRDDDAGLGSD